MIEVINDIWKLISEHEDDNQGNGTACVAGIHIVFGIIGSILAGIFTPLGWYTVITAVLAIILFGIWMAAPEGKMAAGYFFAMTFMSMAWIIYLPVLLLICLLCLPIIIKSYKEYMAEKNDE